MTFEPGIIAIAIAVLLFYMRLAQIRGRKRKEKRQEELARLRSKRKGRANPPEGQVQINYEVGNFYLLGLGVVLMLVGMAAKTTNILPPSLTPYWWVVVTAGVVALILCVK